MWKKNGLARGTGLGGKEGGMGEKKGKRRNWVVVTRECRDSITARVAGMPACWSLNDTTRRKILETARIAKYRARYRTIEILALRLESTDEGWRQQPQLVFPIHNIFVSVFSYAFLFSCFIRLRVACGYVVYMYVCMYDVCMYVCMNVHVCIYVV